jgi:cAMP phosphodiesterase
MKIQLLPSSFTSDGRASQDQRLTCYVIDDYVSIDAGSLALTGSLKQRQNIRDIVITHAHMDHIATLPLFIDDLFSSLTSPVRIHALSDVIDFLETDIFNWRIYPRFSELTNGYGKVIEYVQITPAVEFTIGHLNIKAVKVDHRVLTVGLIISDGHSTIGMTSDTGETDEIWKEFNRIERLDALLIEASFPDSMAELAKESGHLTPSLVAKELEKLNHANTSIFCVHLKPQFRQEVTEELLQLKHPSLTIMQIGREYEW